MNKLEKILGILILLSLVMKYSLIAGGDIILILAISLLSILYYAFGFAFFNHIHLRQVFKKTSYKRSSTSRIIGGVGVGIGLSVVCLGCLFKIEHWPGADINLYIGLTTLFVVIIISLLKFFKNKDSYYIFIITSVH